MPYQHLTLCDRKVIKKMLKNNKSIRYIAGYIGCNPSTISRELHRNKEFSWYHPLHAHEKYVNRRKNSKESKINMNNDLREHIIREIKDKKSPDAISGRLRLTHKKHPDMQVSHETIYRWIYKNAEKGDNLYQYLPRGVKKRNKRLNKKKSRIKIPDRISIHSRPQSVENRQRKGHWEGDTITGKGHSGYIATLSERKSYFIAAGLMKDKRPETCNRSILEAFGNIKNNLIKSITFDNGTEFYYHKYLQEALECKIYFADPYSAWQRGINEHANGLLRRYFPKNMDFKNITQNDVDKVVMKLNHMPHKSLGYKTPYEVFHDQCVALQH